MTRRGWRVAAVAMTIVAIGAAGVVWKILPGASPKIIPAANTSQAPAPSEAPPPSMAVSPIIDLPGAPEFVKREGALAPRELRVDLPAKLALDAPRPEAVAYFASSPLASNTGGFMSKFPEGGQEADALATKLQIDAAALAGASDSSIDATDDDGGKLTQDNPVEQMFTDANSNSLAITADHPPHLKQAIFKPVVAEPIADLLIAQGFDPRNAQDVEARAKAILDVQSLPGRSAAVALGARDSAGAYRVTQLAIYEGGHYVGTVALGQSGVYLKGARPIPPDDLIGDAAAASAAAAAYNLADGVYSAGLRNAIPEPVVREAIQLLDRVITMSNTLSADEAIRILYTRDFRDKSAGAGKVIYVGLSGAAVVYDCYSFEAENKEFRCFDPAAEAAPTPLPPERQRDAPPVETGASAVGGLLAPIKDAPITSLFGMRFHPILHILRLHAGIDFGAAVGSQVRASADGVVEIAQPVSGFGNHIRIQHDGYETSYSHLSEIPDAIKTGVKVRQGEIIALSGNTGLSTGPHLHFQFYLNGQAVDPLPHMGTEVRSAASVAALSAGPGVSIPVAAAPQGGPTEAEVHAFPFVRKRVNDILEAAEK